MGPAGMGLLMEGSNRNKSVMDHRGGMEKFDSGNIDMIGHIIHKIKRNCRKLEAIKPPLRVLSCPESLEEGAEDEVQPLKVHTGTGTLPRAVGKPRRGRGGGRGGAFGTRLLFRSGRDPSFEGSRGWGSGVQTPDRIEWG